MKRFLYNNSLKYRLARHILFFVLTVLSFTVILFVQKSESDFYKTLWITFLNSVFFFSYAYITIFLLIPEFLLTKKTIWFALLFLLVGIALSSLKLVVSDQIFYSSIAPENIENKGMFSLRFIAVNTKDMTFIVALFCITKYIKDYLYAEEIRKEVVQQTKEAQRKLFQSQFDPHFMFNTINNLYAISLLNPVRTAEVINRIKIVLNYIVEEIQKEYVDLKGEVELVKNYIQLEKLRYGNRLKINLNIDGDLKNHLIPPMILFFLVENCFRHGSSLDAGSPWINIEIKPDSGRIFFEVENSKPVGQPQKRKNEIQLNNLRKRLEIMYNPSGYKLDVSDNENTFKVNLELKHDIENRSNTYR